MHKQNPMYKQWWMALLLVVLAGPAIAGDKREVRKQVEASLLVTGTIDVSTDGRVVAYTLDHADELSAGVVRFIDRTVPNWQFEPIELQDDAARARARMTLRLVSRKLDAERYSVRLAATSFVQDRPPASEVRAGDMDPPRYPHLAARHGVTGTVYTVLKVGRDGAVEDAVIERVNLRVIDDSERMAEWRDILAEVVLREAHEWTFVPPSQGDAKDAPFWSVRVPVDFRLDDDEPDYAKWEAYVPGPLHSIPWLDDKWSAGSDALVAGGVYPLESAVRLLTPLDPAS